VSGELERAHQAGLPITSVPMQQFQRIKWPEDHYGPHTWLVEESTQSCGGFIPRRYLAGPGPHRFR
jgi:hypothetical protein